MKKAHFFNLLAIILAVVFVIFLMQSGNINTSYLVILMIVVNIISAWSLVDKNQAKRIIDIMFIGLINCSVPTILDKNPLQNFLFIAGASIYLYGLLQHIYYKFKEGIKETE